MHLRKKWIGMGFARANPFFSILFPSPDYGGACRVFFARVVRGRGLKYRMRQHHCSRTRRGYMPINVLLIFNPSIYLAGRFRKKHVHMGKAHVHMFLPILFPSPEYGGWDRGRG